MADDKLVMKQPLLLPRTTTTTTKKKLPPPSFLKWLHQYLHEAADYVVRIHLVLALFFACLYGGFAAYNLLRNNGPSCCQVPPPPPPPTTTTWLVHTYVLTGADAVAAVVSLERGQAWCSAFQAATAALALLQLPAVHGGGGGGGLRLRALALAALTASAANHWMYLRMLDLIRIASPGDHLALAVETATINGAAAQNLIGFLGILLLRDE